MNNINFSIYLPNSIADPKIISMTGSGAPELPADLWRCILSFFPTAEMHGFCAVNRSWNFIVKGMMCQKLEGAARFLFHYRETTYDKWLELETSQNRPSQWENILKWEEKTDRKLLQGNVEEFKEKEVELPQSTFNKSENYFLFDKHLISCGPSKPKENEVSQQYFLRIYNLERDAPFKISLGNTFTISKKISEKAFIILQKHPQFEGVNHIHLWELRQKSFGNKPPQIISYPSENPIMMFNLEGRQLISQKLMREKEGDFLCLTAYPLCQNGEICHSRLSIENVIESERKDYEHLLTHFNSKYFVVASVKKNEPDASLVSIYNRVDGKLRIHMKGVALKILGDKVIFANKQTQEILLCDLSQPESIFSTLLKMEKCYAVYMTSQFFLLIDKSSLYLYNVQSKNLKSYSLFKGSKEIHGSEFIRVTEKLVVLLFHLSDQEESPNKKLYYQVVAYSLHPNMEKIWQSDITKKHPILFNENYLATIKFPGSLNVSQSNENPRQVKGFRFGARSKKMDWVLANTLSFRFEIKNPH